MKETCGHQGGLAAKTVSCLCTHLYMYIVYAQIVHGHRCSSRVYIKYYILYTHIYCTYKVLHCIYTHSTDTGAQGGCIQNITFYIYTFIVYIQLKYYIVYITHFTDAGAQRGVAA